jgi:hypothetical protein
MGGGNPPEVMTIIRYTMKKVTPLTKGPRFSVSSTGYKNLTPEIKAAIMTALGLAPQSKQELMNGTINIYELK